MADTYQTQALVQARGENFPVASWLLPEAARAPIRHFYAFARHADDIADSPHLPVREKILLLGHLQQALREGDPAAAPEWAQAHIRDTMAGICRAEHGVNLLTAFLQDARQTRYLTFGELLDYCRFSAMPVGRAVLECCGEDAADPDASDALCALLQLINHMQDCQKDYRELNRIYLPKTWMQEQRASADDLDAAATSPALRAVFDRYLAECRRLLAVAAPLPRSIRSRRLRLELALVLELAATLVDRLSREDPLQKPVKIAHWTWPVHFIRSLRRL